MRSSVFDDAQNLWARLHANSIRSDIRRIDAVLENWSWDETDGPQDEVDLKRLLMERQRLVHEWEQITGKKWIDQDLAA